MIEQNTKVSHVTLGNGSVVSVLPNNSAVVIFGDGQPHIVPLSELTEEADINSAISNAVNVDSDSVLARAQSALIETINNKWGVFSRSAIDLLPHQLWVCNQVLKKWPVRYLVADDVGLGKTIEAGLIIWGLIESRKIQRILIITPAALTNQWEQRMSDQFDLNFDVYNSANDSDSVNYWKKHNMIIVSASTIQLKHNERQIDRQNKLFEAAPWDLVIVDEAHHMNAENAQGSTLQYQLFDNLQKAGKIISTVFFTGTPHRGIDYGFWMLMKLVAPDEFDPRLNVTEQYAKLGKYFIRNNKANTVDMNGKKLFQPIIPQHAEFEYTTEEAEFYNKMTEFISTGKAYAQTLSAKEISQVQLVLIAFQKIASSSICAVKGALIHRKNNLLNITSKADSDTTAASDWFTAMNSDEDEPIKQKDVAFVLMKDEIKNLEELIELANKVTHESRIDKIIEIIKTDYPDENILFFTEYKQTQSLLMTELMKCWGENSVTFINGDESLPEVKLPDGSIRRFDKKRTEAAKEFNEGKKKFLISTEAAGEGIDLQESCHVIIHADLPWNPMRLHQRVGRLNRYGQTHAVSVVTLRNPETVESMLWDKLEHKIDNIQQAFSAGMDDPEDMMQLVLGMQTSKYFTNIFSEGSLKTKESLNTWFDAETQSFGNTDAINTVKSLVGNAAKFNLAGLKDVPKVDLPDLLPFFRRVLKLKGRQLMDTGNDSWGFITPEDWSKEYGFLSRYKGLVFRRKLNPGENPKSICGAGYKMFDKCLDYADMIKDSACAINGNTSYFIYKVYDMKSDNETRINSDYIVISSDSKTGEIKQLELDEAFKQINCLGSGKSDENYILSVPEKAEEIIKAKLPEYNYALPASELQIVLCGAAN